MSKYIVVTGDREWSNFSKIREKLLALQSENPDITIIHGDCRGADECTDLMCEELGIDRIKVPANWVRYGNPAGPIRNTKMLRMFKPHLVIAFHPDLTKSRGTRNCVEQARKLGIKVEIIS